MPVMTATEKRQRLRAILNGPRCVTPLTVFDALSARIADSVGGEVGILSGSVCAATMLGAPDLALQTLTEFADQVRRVTRASNLSIFVDADHGYGNALNAMRTIEELEHAGLSGLAIEDVVLPARFGGPELELVSIEEMSGKLRAAVSARHDPSLVIAARTAALRIEGAEGAAARVQAYAKTGVDAIFVTAMQSLAELDAIRKAVALPIILGTAPRLERKDVEARGVRIALQGHSPVAAVAKALRDTYSHLRAGGRPSELKAQLASAGEMSQVLGEERYAKWRSDFLVE
jgi:carboxyvinyl-carboxyphosphonate phosphorylmutase